MTHYDVDYSDIPDEILKHNTAIQDIKNYLGEERFEHNTKVFKQEPAQIPFKQFEILCGLLIGVQGYPVKAWYNYIYPL